MNQGHECTGTNNQCNNTVLNAANKYECECTNSYIPTGQNAPPQTCLEAGKPGTYCTSAGQGCEVKLIFTAQRGLFAAMPMFLDCFWSNLHSFAASCILTAFPGLLLP
jgi:hypothetical protein